ncbi:MAG: hypothetical protein IJC74_07595 [Clostridia bacterium]|nr:hypothetical protein [Clostridia bacterium]
MIRILIGPKGTGKTKTFINMVNDAIKTEKGNTVCISTGDRHIFDIASDIRLVNIDEFSIKNVDAFYGLISGIMSQNFDITHIFIDSILKIVPMSLQEFNDVIPCLEKISEKFNVEFTIAVSSEADAAMENIAKYTVKL